MKSQTIFVIDGIEPITKRELINHCKKHMKDHAMITAIKNMKVGDTYTFNDVSGDVVTIEKISTK